MAAMRIAIAGSNSLAISFALRIQQDTNYQFVILSRQDRPNLNARDIPVLVVDYADTTTLQHALLGVDVVISTVTGSSQINLIHAAVNAGVSRFAPAEFGLNLNIEGAAHDPLDRGRAEAVQWLNFYKGTHGIEYCAFICGILYERFDQGGLLRHALGVNSGVAGEGDFLVNIRNMTAEAPFNTADGRETHICLTAMRDVAAFVVQALGMREWPTVMTMHGERMTVRRLVHMVESVRGVPMQATIEHDMQSLMSELQLAMTLNGGQFQRTPREMRALLLIATAGGRFDFTTSSLNARFRNIRTLRLRDWLTQQWTTQ